jgi:hypothetical protein
MIIKGNYKTSNRKERGGGFLEVVGQVWIFGNI